MGTIIFIEHDGTEHSTELGVGKSLMQIALDHGIPGIDADCGGECACGTCHVILNAKWIHISAEPQRVSCKCLI